MITRTGDDRYYAPELLLGSSYQYPLVEILNYIGKILTFGRSALYSSNAYLAVTPSIMKTKKNYLRT